MKKICVLFLGVVALVSCNTLSARKYNDMIVQKEKSLVPQLQATETGVAAFINEKKYDSVVAISERMEKSIDGVIADLNKTPVPSANGAEDFKKAYSEYFTYMKEIYTGYKNVGQAKTDEDRQKEAVKVMTLAQKRTVVLSTLQEAQRKFASANNLALEEK